MTIFPFFVKEINKNEIDEESDNNSGNNETYMNFNSGTFYAIENCMSCQKNISHSSANMIRLPNLNIISYEYGNLLEKKFPEKVPILKGGIFCNITCFKDYIKKNTSKQISIPILAEIEKFDIKKKVSKHEL